MIHCLCIIHNMFIKLLHQCATIFLNTCLCPKETSLPDSCSKLCGIPGWKKQLSWKQTIRNQTPPQDCCLTFSSPHNVQPLQTVHGAQKDMCFLSQVFQNKIQQSFCLATCVLFPTTVVIRFSGRQEELQWPSADRTLDSKRDRFVVGSLSLEKCLSMCGRAHMYAHWDYFCWLIRTSSRKSCCGFTCWNVLFAPGNVFFLLIDLATVTPFIEVSALRLFFATQHWLFHDSPNVSTRLVVAFCDLFQLLQMPCG